MKLRGVEIRPLGALPRAPVGGKFRRRIRSRWKGKDTREPAFNVPAKWIPPSFASELLAAGYAVVDQPSVVARTSQSSVKQHAFELLTRQETKRLLDGLAETQPKLIEELVPKLLSLGEVQRVLQQVLREHVRVHDLATILETLVDIFPASKNPIVLVEAVRRALGTLVCSSPACG